MSGFPASEYQLGILAYSSPSAVQIDALQFEVSSGKSGTSPFVSFPPDFYAEMLKAAARSIRKADPEAKIVGMGGSYSYTWCLDVIKSLGGNPHDFMDLSGGIGT